MTRQTWTAAVSAVWFLVLAIVIALAPSPFVTYAPGSTYELLGQAEGQDVIQVEGLPTHAATGQIRAATVDVTPLNASVALPEVLYAHWAPDRDAIPREWHYPTRTSLAELRDRESQRLSSAQMNAAAAALRAAGVAVQQIPMVSTVAQAGPAIDLMLPGDFVLAVDGRPCSTVEEVRAAVEARTAGDPVVLTVLRGTETLTVTIQTTASSTRQNVPVWGGTLVMGFSYAPIITFHLDPAMGGGSGGMMLALATFDRVTDGGLVGDLVVAGSGVIDGAGNISRAEGIPEKLAAAERDGAEVFLIPLANCADVTGIQTRMRLVSVGTLDDAIASVDALNSPDTEALVEGCS